MPNNNYIRGRALEYDVIKYLRSKDWYAIRSAGSHGVADVIAMKRAGSFTDVLLIQCKTGSARCSVDEWNELFDLSERIGATPILCTREKNHAKKFYEIIGRKDSDTETKQEFDI